MTSIIELNNQIQKIIEQIQNGSKDFETIEVIIPQIKRFMEEYPDSRRELGAQIGQLKSLKNETNHNHENINWVNLLAGSISIGHRPKLKELKYMKLTGVTHIFTLLSEKEGAKQIEAASIKEGLTWLWLPLASANPPEEDKHSEIRNILNTCQKELEKGAKIYIHCSAGIHRTGMITYALLKHLGFEKDKAIISLHKMRDVTSKEVGAHRIAWGDSFVVDKKS